MRRDSPDPSQEGKGLPRRQHLIGLKELDMPTETTHPPSAAIAELHPLLAHYELLTQRRPDQGTRCMVELGVCLEIVGKSIRRGSITQNQLTDLRRRAVFMEKQANG
jgi:hypothetical protein